MMVQDTHSTEDLLSGSTTQKSLTLNHCFTEKKENLGHILPKQLLLNVPAFQALILGYLKYPSFSSCQLIKIFGFIVFVLFFTSDRFSVWCEKWNKYILSQSCSFI